MDQDTRPPARPRRGKRPRRRQQREAPGVASRVQAAERSLSAAFRAAFQEMFGSLSGPVGPFALTLDLRVEPGNGWRLHADPALEDQIRASVREMAVRAEVYQPGRVYCYRCDSSRCPHSVPPGPGCVFGGYASNGLPLWPELVQVLLEQRHAQIDTLFQPGGYALAVACMSPEVLKQRQLNVFGRESKTYDILGQVVFGFVEMTDPDRDRREAERVAFTVQAVEVRSRDGLPRLELNVLGRLASGTPALDAVAGPYQTRIFHTVASARRRMQSLVPHPPGDAPGAPGPRALGEPVLEQLRRLSRTLEKVGRQRGRRTTHAEDRRFSRRHTSSAWRDAVTASDELFLWDEQKRTVVVLGPRNRVHVFRTDARHVTRLLLQAEEIRSRRRRKRWVPFTGEPLVRFRETLEKASLRPAPRE